ncbi:acyl-CoA thioesterase [Caenimonas soli]|uniref:acyl-CoA thioesterase n=1 Tax=Caenimonas soli TaxID=2735555 RepID=UPI0015533C95|nr:acyl-CoA thioesterase [Caenimonas soli]NPC59108.1 acyl-CoA thioesterase [Caenimonas soli]
MKTQEAVICEAPVTIRPGVKWGDFDPAGVVYTVTFAEYLTGADWPLYGGCLFGTRTQQATNNHGLGTPTRALSFDFVGSLWANDQFEMTLHALDVPTRTFDVQIAARKHGELVFTAQLTPICIPRGEKGSVEIRPMLRSVLDAYRRACGNPLLSSASCQPFDRNLISGPASSNA